MLSKPDTIQDEGYGASGNNDTLVCTGKQRELKNGDKKGFQERNKQTEE